MNNEVKILKYLLFAFLFLFFFFYNGKDKEAVEETSEVLLSLNMKHIKGTSN